MDEDSQYDSSLGGSQKLLSRVNVLNFVADRAKEVQDMREALRTSTSTKLAFQRLPKHMRRRAMSHNVKRLPRRLREIHLNQLKKSGATAQHKKASRKYRRRPQNLLSECRRRQKRCTWLETHLWHAKRFHMIEKWHHRLADRPCDKTFRACYRASSKHCLIQDVSFFKCVQICAAADILISRIKSVSNNNIDLSVGAKAFIKGNREGKFTLFHNNMGREIAVGVIYFHWQPLVDQNITQQTLWLWIHAAYYTEALNILIECFQLKKNNELYQNEELKVDLTELSDNLNRFRLTGPLSLAVLYNALKLYSPENGISEWCKDYLLDSENLKIFEEHRQLWENLKDMSPFGISPGVIVSLIVDDPRLAFPKTRTKADLSSVVTKQVDVLQHAAWGPIWDSKIRNVVKESKITNARLAEMRMELLVPGSELAGTAQAVPIMIVHRVGMSSTNFGYSSGFDLIVPSGWGNTFWISLIMWGARAGGLREFDAIRFECGLPEFLAPDTAAGLVEELEVAEVCKRKFFKLPPNKRPNYTKLGITSPFNCDWKTLIAKWNSSGTQTFFVLREREKLTQIQQLLQCTEQSQERPTPDFTMDCIVPVRLKLKQKGLMKRFARIYLPELPELSSMRAPVEPLHSDENQQRRKEMRDAHKHLLKQLRRKRIKAKSQKLDKKKTPENSEAIHSYAEEIRKLWLPEPVSNIKTACSRQLIGFVTAGDFSFTQACGCAIGYVAMGAVQALLTNSQSSLVLVRNITSRQYRFATVEVIV